MTMQENSLWSRSFELVYYDPSPDFQGRTHFRDPENDALTTEQRIAYVEAYTDLLRRENDLGERYLSTEVVSDEESERLASQIKNRPMSNQRNTVPLCFWRWKLQGAENDEWAAPDFDDSVWNELEVPTVLDMGRAMLLRSTAHIEPSERVVLDIESIHDEYDLWVNGQSVVHHKGYEPHSVDITSVIRAGQENTFAIKVAEKKGYQIGIAGSIQLVGTRSAYIEDVFVKPVEAMEDRPARVQIITTVRNAGDQAFTGRLAARFYRWFPEEDSTVAYEMPSMEVQVGPGQAVELNQECNWSGAELWWPERPRIYRLEATLSSDDDERMDDYADTVGIRTIEQRGGRFYLNGRRFVMRGFCDNLGFAPAPDSHGATCPPDAWIARDLILAKRANANTVRIHPWGFSGKLGQYDDRGWPVWGLPTDGTNYGRIAEIADQIGICLVWVTRHWTLWADGFREHYNKDEMETLLVPSLKQVRNHPSIISYEGLNEVGVGLGPRVILGREGAEPEWTSHLLPQEVETLTEFHVRLYRDFCASYIRLVNSVDDSRVVCPDSQWGPGYQSFAERSDAVQFDDESVFTMAENVYWDFHHYPGWYTDIKDMYARKERFWPDDRARAVICGEYSAEAMPDWNRYRGLPWRSTWLNNGRPTGEIEQARLGRPLRVLRDSEAHLSQAYHGLSIYHSAVYMRATGCDGMISPILADGLSEGQYHKGFLDLHRRAKLGYFAVTMTYQPTLVTGMDGDFVFSRDDSLHLVLVNDAPQRVSRPATVLVQAKKLDGSVVDSKEVRVTIDDSGIMPLGEFQPQFPSSGLYQIEYTVVADPD